MRLRHTDRVEGGKNHRQQHTDGQHQPPQLVFQLGNHQEGRDDEHGHKLH